MSSTVCRARKTLPCQQNHLSRASWATTLSADAAGGGARRPFGELGQHGEAHRDVEPVQQVFGLRVQVEREVAHVVGAVGEEGDLLVGLHALGGEQLEQPPLGFGVVGLDEAEAFGRPVGGHALAGDDLEPAVAAGALPGRVHVAAVQADGQRQVRAGQLRPVGRAALDEERAVRGRVRRRGVAPTR